MKGYKRYKKKLYKKKSAFSIYKPSKKDNLLGEHKVNITNMRQLVRAVENIAHREAPERKYNEDAAGESPYYITTGTPFDLSTTFGAFANNIGQGTDQQSRIGNKIRCVDMNWKLITRLTNAFGNDCVSYRVLVIVQKIPDTAITSWGALAADYLADFATITDPKLVTLAGINRLNAAKYVTLVSKMFTLDDIKGLSRVHKFHIKLDFETEYFGSGVGDITKNAIWYGIIPSNLATGAFYVTSYMTMNYTDV